MRTITPCITEHGLVDIAVQQAASPTCPTRPHAPALHMLGSGGAERELRIIQNIHPASCQGVSLPVFLGAGLGHALKAFLQDYEGPLAVVDKEWDILQLTNIKEQIAAQCGSAVLERITWIPEQDTTLVPSQATGHMEADPHAVLRALTKWQQKHGGKAFTPIIHPFYQRLHKQWYGFIRKHLEASEKYDFWSKVRRARFQNEHPRLLLITSKYFLMGEVASACERLGIAHKLLTIPDDTVASHVFIEDFLTAVADFQPDCLLTLNHLGVDREGILMGLLEQLELPLASWFVDNPHLIVHLYEKLKSPWVSIFSWDLDNIDSLHAMGFEHVFYLPLGTNPHLFCPNTQGKKTWKSEVSFVGNSMLHKVRSRLDKTCLPPQLLATFTDTAQKFGQCDMRSIEHFLQTHCPQEYTLYANLPSHEERLGYETALTWEATRIYRASCVAQTLPFTPLIVGDDGWNTIFASQRESFTLHDVLSYYTDLPAFYPLSDINFNCTSKQMKGAVNQRIFDVPACNAFVLTDWREQMDDLFEPHKEIAFYTNPEEIPDLIKHYLAHPKERQRITAAARKRVLAEHTWDHRLQTLLMHMRTVYATPAKQNV